MSYRDYPGNESLTISLTDLWYFSSEILISAIKFLKRLLKSQGYTALCQSINQALVAISKIIII